MTTEEALRRAEAARERAENDLRQFVYAASHDLQEPLRKIVAFGELLERRAGPKLDEETLSFVRRMRTASLRLSTLVSDLLEYSRLLSEARPLEDVDLGEAASRAAAALARAAEPRPRFEIARLPTVRARPTQIRRLFDHLLGNAVKFRDPKRPLVVRVSAREADDGVEIEVVDNGIGFPPERADSILEPFVRLNPRAEYEGSGLGLAVCRRIAESHGGRLTARGQPGRGAAFTVLLPAGRGRA